MNRREEPILQIEGVTLRYPGEKPGELGTLALEEINLEVNKGEFISVVGPSGCGKSTLLSAVAGLLTQYQGSIRMNGQEVRGPIPDIGVVFQEDSTFPWRSALRNVEFGLEMKGIAKQERREKALEVLKMVGLNGFEERYPSQLSGGMRQRVAIARTLVMEPAMLLMDEPFGALDEQTRLILGGELLKIVDKTQATVLLVTHSIQEAALLSDKIVVLSPRPGRVKSTIMSDLPYDRDASILSSHEFSEMTEEIWYLLKEESVASTRFELQKKVVN